MCKMHKKQPQKLNTFFTQKVLTKLDKGCIIGMSNEVDNAQKEEKQWKLRENLTIF